MAALDAARPGASRFVGGCVRNTLMGRPVDDIDLATQLRPDAVIDAMQRAGIRVIPTGLEHGTVTAIIDQQPFEITTLRRDVETDGRHAVVAFSEDWTEDAARRDFRLNALYADREGRLFDPTGGGLEDAAAGRVIFIGDPQMRLREDYLRILRFFRFNAWYGAGLDAAGLRACETEQSGLAQIAAERIWKEVEKLLSAPEPAPVLLAMEETGILNRVIAGATAAHITAYIASQNGRIDPIGRLIALLPREFDRAEAVSNALRLSNAERGRLLAWAADDIALDPKMPAQALRGAAYRLGRQTYFDRAHWAMAWLGGEWSRLLHAVDGWIWPQCPVRGQDLLDRGLSGPAIGERLRMLESRWIDSDFQLDAETLLNSPEQ